MAAIDDLVSQIEDAGLRARIEAELARMAKQKKFGLVFEEHLPERTPLYGVPIKKGSLVAKRDGSVNETYRVSAIEGENAVCLKQGTDESVEIPLASLVVAAEFGEPIYPYLQPLDSICNAPESGLWHTLIEADNYHALQLLEYLYRGKVDCIYIDPPYNTGARDWKYNNDYVDGSDQYRHSKWLSMMQKRLKIAKRLLNPADSVLIVTIDEKEYLHLGCLLEEMFPEARIQMITNRINKKGSPRPGVFSRCDEYIFYLFFGCASICKTDDDMISSSDEEIDAENTSDAPLIWNNLLRRGTGGLRQDSPTLFFPIFVNPQENKIVAVGDSLPITEDRNSVKAPVGCEIAWPLRSNGAEGRWQVSPPTLREYLLKGTVRLGKKNKSTGSWAINYLKRKQLDDLRIGKIKCFGKNPDGSLILEYVAQTENLVEPKTMWVRDCHDASVYGSTLLKKIISGRHFSFPKSLYAVRDCLKFFVANKPDALIVDFFAGSGTTLHAVNLLNAEDGGCRRCIMVTNNEVSADEAKYLSAKGLKPGDEQWEERGIARYINWTRTVCSIKGRDAEDGIPLSGNYLGSDLPMADGFKTNAVFFKLGFLDKNAVSLGRQFAELLPLLWLKAGAHGECPTVGENLPPFLILPANQFAVLLDEADFAAFQTAMAKDGEAIKTIYFITDSLPSYKRMAARFPAKTTYQLYRDYLENFRINVRD